jgi:hypothetical protein
MFRWYKQAEVCYAYLSDVWYSSNERELNSQLSKSRWFTRGWTLQELIAPKVVVFYSEDWRPLGTRSELCKTISSITRIEPEYLNGMDLEFASVAKRMSWAARRETSRTEDVAYSLLGIFDINMPLIYGEGRKAFRRLQEEIMKSTPEDHSLFAWGEIHGQIIPQTEQWVEAAKQLSWGDTEQDDTVLGLLAESPKEFEFSGQFIPSILAGSFYRGPGQRVNFPSRVNKAVHIELPILPFFTYYVYKWRKPQVTQVRFGQYAVLLCAHEKYEHTLIAMPLFGWGDTYVGRRKEFMLYDRRNGPWGFQDILFPFAGRLWIAPEKSAEPRRGDIILRRPSTHCIEPVQWVKSYTNHGLPLMVNAGLLQASPSIDGTLLGTSYKFPGTEIRGFAIVISRTQSTDTVIGRLTVGVVRICLSTKSEETDSNGVVWYNEGRVFAVRPTYFRRMSTPRDVWVPDIPGLPVIRIEVERMTMGSDDATVDVLDITIKSQANPFQLGTLESALPTYPVPAPLPAPSTRY